MNIINLLMLGLRQIIESALIEIFGISQSLSLIKILFFCKILILQEIKIFNLAIHSGIACSNLSSFHKWNVI